MKGLDLTKIFDSMKQNEISELIIKEGSRIYEIRRGGFKHKIVGESAPVMPQVFAQPAAVQAPVQQVSMPQTHAAVHKETSQVETKKEESKSNLHEIKSPLVGTFYASPKPEAPAFVEVGSKVRKGQTLCLVEAMKNFNEIESDVDGVIREICVKNGELVEFGKVLFRIEKQ